MTEGQQHEWQKTLEAVRQMKDGRGLPVDEQIVETVAIFKLLGFTTTGSCAGHPDRITGGPYVIFESPEAIRLAAEARSLQKPVGEVDPRYNELRNEASRHSMLEVNKLIPYLELFYAGRDVPYARRLIIRTFPMTYNCLKCQGAELAYATDEQSRKKILEENRAEMWDFTDFLKHTTYPPIPPSPPIAR